MIRTKIIHYMKECMISQIARTHANQQLVYTFRQQMAIIGLFANQSLRKKASYTWDEGSSR